MAIDVDYKQVTAIERRQIDGQIKQDLVEHLYKSNVTAVLTGVLTSICFFMYYYHHTGFIQLLSWFIGFNLVLTYITAITIVYKKNRSLCDVNTWEIAL